VSKRIIMLDASALKQSACNLQLYHILVNGYRGRLMPNDIEFGTAFHAYRKEIEEGDGSPVARFTALRIAMDYYTTKEMIVKPKKAWLDLTYLKNTCLGYDEHYEKTGEEWEVAKLNGKPLVEIRIAYPYFVDDRVEVILCGTIDGIMRSKISGMYAIKDYKTTSLWDKAGYFNAYRLSAQLMFYKLLLTLYARQFPDGVIAEAAKGGAFIDGIFLGASKAAAYARSEIYSYDEAKMVEFEAGVRETVETKILPYARGDRKPWREGVLTSACEKVYGQCGFFEACASGSEEGAEMVLESKYVRGEYNPMKHGDTK